MMSEAQTAAQNSLNILESRFSQFCLEEQHEIAALREVLRNLINKYGASASLAIIAVGFEVAILEKQ